MGAGQAMSGHLRRRLVTTVQELLGAEHVAGVCHSVHTMQDVDLGRESSVGTGFSARPIPLSGSHC